MMLARAFGTIFWLLLLWPTTTTGLISEKRTHLYSLDEENRCLLFNKDEDPPAPQYTQYNEKQMNLTLATTDRLSHQIITNYLMIYLKENLGYRDVKIIRMEDHLNTEQALAETINSDEGPQWMINAEVWIPPEEDTGLMFEHYDVKDCGSAGPPAKIGWFIPKILTKSLPNVTNYLDIHWSMFTDDNFASHFTITDKKIMKMLRDNSEKNTNCTQCDGDGFFIPDLCKNSSRCALLLAPNYMDTHFVIDHIVKLKMHVSVVWLGDNLMNMSIRLTEMFRLKVNQSLVILSWMPSEIINPEIDFTSVSFPSCNLLESQGLIGCKYEMNRLTKITWTKLRYAAPNAYEFLHYFSASREDLERVFDLHRKRPEMSPAQLACDWLRWERETEPTMFKRKLKIIIGGIFPLSGNASLAYTGKGIKAAAMMAQTAINKSPSLLRDYEIQLTSHDGMCKPENVMKSFIDMIHNNYLLGVLGPACSETVEPLAGVSKMFNILTISYSAEGVNFVDRTKYPYFFRTIGENQHYIPVYRNFFRAVGWKQVASLTEDGQKYTEYLSHLEYQLGTDGVYYINVKFPREREPDAMKKYMDDLKKKRAKIIIVDANDDAVRHIMCHAYHLNMTAYDGYVWFLPKWLTEDWFNISRYNARNNETVKCTTQMMQHAINGYFSLSYAYYASNDAILETENITVGEWRDSYKTFCSRLGTTMSNYGGYAYDAMWTYALALDKMLEEIPEAAFTLRSPTTAMNLVKHIKEIDFNGVSGRIKFGNNSPSRFSFINIIQWYSGKTHIVATFEPNMTHIDQFHGHLTVNMSMIKWLHGKSEPPSDGTNFDSQQCVMLQGFADLLNVHCDVAMILFNISLIGVLIVIAVAGIVVFKRRYEQKLMQNQKLMRSLGLDLLAVSNTLNLDKWEIPRDRVVINRKLGEGEFGTVYGGEAYFPDKGWIGVAVKTLKIGSTTEEKLDFLSEAETMKRFDHKNIVKLVAVCTQNEPVYTIMEFMLYGDLKTYLLARRHLVSNNSYDDNDEISSKKLTSMALDVARALSYLAEIKFVHRDVACRNCLLNAQRMVKLGDFGMTRPMFENDYYKFNRKGMLPVRWMAPESLGLGVFTPSSDIWSFGVLLYEIITFGSFPFQGMTNFQVLEYVKTGNILKIPSDVKPQLEALMRSCWDLDHKRRPHASQIVDFLANNPRLVTPCLDVPLSSVQMDDSSTNVEQLGLPEVFRKYSMDAMTTSTILGGDFSNNSTAPWRTTLSFEEENDEFAIHSNDCDFIESIPLEQTRHLSLTRPLLDEYGISSRQNATVTTAYSS